MLYYTLTITAPNGVTTKQEKLKHNDAMQAINDTILSYGFNKPIKSDTFHNILSRPTLLPERLKWIINTGKLKLERTHEQKKNIDIVQFMQSIPSN